MGRKLSGDLRLVIMKNERLTKKNNKIMILNNFMNKFKKF
jgi:hypothetical protein